MAHAGEVSSRTNRPSVCALCSQAKTLCKSHIVPEFLYSPLYDDKHRFLQLSTNPTARPAYRQKGLHERLLCTSCECRLSAWESYAARVWNDALEPSHGQLGSEFVISPVDYRVFKLFTMSLLWRAGVSTLPEFAAVQLGQHEKSLRKMINTEDPGLESEFNFLIILQPAGSVADALRETIIPPEIIRSGNYDIYRFGLRGSFWLFSVPGHSKFYSLFEDGRLLIRNGRKLAANFATRLVTDLSQATQKRAELGI